MKRNMLAVLMAFVLCVTGLMSWKADAKAEVESADIDFSNLFTKDAIVGYPEMQTRGVYLVGGYSIINRLSSTKVGAGGVTEAAIRCTVKINPILEQKIDGSWARVTSWNETKESALSVSVSKSVTVDRGYYYCVRSYHYAGSDVTGSSTDALWVN